jgi:transcriptional regulator with XRE-family HTH domain
VEDAAKFLAKRLRALRAALNLSQEATAQFTRLSYKHYQEIEGARKPGVRLSTLQQIGDVFGLKIWELLGKEMPVPRRKPIFDPPPHRQRSLKMRR